MIDRSRLFFFQAACTAAMRADGHGGCGSGVQPQLADGPSMPERRLRVGGQRVPRKSNECRLDKLFFSAGQSSALFVANCSGRTVAIRTFRRDRRSCLGSESDGPYGDTVPDCVQPRYVTAKVVPEGVLRTVWAKFSDDVEIPEDLEEFLEQQMDCTLKKGRRGNAPGPGTWWDAQLFVRPWPAGPTLVGPLNLVGPRWRDTAASRFAGGLLPKVGVCNCPHPSSSGPTAKVSESSIGSLEGRRSVCFAQPPGVVTMVKGNKIFNISRSLCPESGPILHTGGPRCAIPNLS